MSSWMSAPVQLMFRGGIGRWWMLCRLRLRVPQVAALQGRTYHVSRFPVITVNKQIISNKCDRHSHQRVWRNSRQLRRHRAQETASSRVETRGSSEGLPGCRMAYRSDALFPFLFSIVRRSSVYSRFAIRFLFLPPTRSGSLSYSEMELFGTELWATQVSNQQQREHAGWRPSPSSHPWLRPNPLRPAAAAAACTFGASRKPL